MMNSLLSSVGFVKESQFKYKFTNEKIDELEHAVDELESLENQ